MWEMYSGGRGYNLEFNYEKFFQAFCDGKTYISYIMIFKDESFSYEGEYRAVYNVINWELESIKHRVKDGKIVPYIELVVEGKFY